MELAAELNDLIEETMKPVFPAEARDAKITVVEALDHILSTYDARISSYTESHFKRSNIHVASNTFVKEVCTALASCAH